MTSDSPTTGLLLVGFMGAGKSTVGSALAADLGLPFVDLDALSTERFGPIAEQFATHGEATFRDRESALLEEVLAGAPCVLATGGGIVERPRNRALMSRWRTMFLDAPLETCAVRIGKGDGRPVWAEAAERFQRRRSLYRFALHVLDATSTVDQIVQDAKSALRMPMEPLPLAPPYPMVFTRRFDGLAQHLQALEPDGILVVTDDRVGPLWLPALREAIGDVPVVSFPHGETNKNVGSWLTLVDGLLAHSPSRSTLVLALGGGVTGDMVGFAASVVLRGLRVVQLPTTTLSMVDSSVGGKTAINHAQGKNLVGTFHQPHLVWMAMDTLTTLPERERTAGLAEALKMAATHDAAGFELLEAVQRPLSQRTLEHILRAGVRVKAAVVAEDVLERGARKTLNAGHTIGHALERALGYGRLLHGEAVSIGLVLETRWAEMRGVTTAGTSTRIERAAAALGLPTEWPEDVDLRAFSEALMVDKKASRATLDLPCVTAIGSCRILNVPIHTFTRAVLDLVSATPP